MQSKFGWRNALAAAAVLATAAPAMAQTQSATAPPAVTNTVHCTYDMMTIDDREMALLLFEREVRADRATTVSRNLKVIDRLVYEAQIKCAAVLRWSPARAAAATAFAMNALMIEGVSQALDSKAHTTAPISAYFDAHRAELAGLTSVNGAAAENLSAYLVALGWDKTDQAALVVAGFYLEALITAQASERAFSAAPVDQPRLTKPPKRSPGRAKTARRDKP